MSLASPQESWIGPPRVGPGAVLAHVVATPRRLWRARDLVAACLARELRGRVAGTVLGPLWPLVHPLALFLVYGFLFTEVLGLRLPGEAGGLTGAYGVYLFSGVLVWSSVGECATRGAGSLLEGRELVRKLAFPPAVLPLVPVLASTLLLGAGALCFAALGAATGLAPASPSLLALPAVLGLHGLLCAGLAWGLAGLNACLRDVGQALPLGLTAAMLAAPVFWVADPSVTPSLAEWLPLVEANPVTALLDAWRAVLLAGRGDARLAPELGPALADLAGWALALALSGRALLARLEPLALDEV